MSHLWFLTLFLLLKTGNNVPIQQEVGQYKIDFAKSVAEPYRKAVSILAEQVVKWLVDSPVPPDAQSAYPLVSNLTQRVGQLTQQVNAAFSGSEILRLRLDTSLESYVAQHSNTEKELNNVTIELNQAEIRIQNADTQLATAQQQVNQAESALRAAEESVRAAEQKVEDARNCIARGKRSFFSKVASHVNHHVDNAARHVSHVGQQVETVAKKVVNAPCEIINEGGIRMAKDGRDAAQRNRDEAVQRLKHLQATKSQLVAQSQQLLNTKLQLVPKRDSLQITVNVLNAARSSVTELGQKLKKVLQQVGAFKIRNEVLSETILKLIDAEALLIPMQAAADLVVTYTGDLNDSNFYQTIKQSLIQNLQVLRAKLPQYPMIENQA